MATENEQNITRRQVLATGLASAAAATLATGLADEAEAAPGKSTRMPVAFLPHGGGPWPFVEMGMDKREVTELAGYLKSVHALPKVTPKALLVVSAHWEEAVPTVMTSSQPPMLFDYYGFPPESYKLTWPAPGEPKLAARVQALLQHAGFASATDAKRGFDHGTFVPLKLTYPNAEIPTVQLSLKRGLDPAEHLAIGRALAPLRDEGVFIVGSGMTYHNMRGFGNPSARPSSEAFDQWLQATGTAQAAERDARLKDWTQAPSARLVHPREEHLLPMMVVAGAAGADRGRVAWTGTMMGVRLSAYHFG
jgi:aromatic ring-opening dioxygenase catalytic subunit (LigB family)